MPIEPDTQARERKDLAEALRDLRRASGLSGERLALRCNMSQTKISRTETGRALPTVIDVERILNALAVPADVAEEILRLARRAISITRLGVRTRASGCTTSRRN
ncbi:helix-turn-helix domain-containing protein [Streptomyces sp. NPDC057877]|uniref:helix-turn-helix domain-containing protein n=1 Tax=Streptomyces sp. NPDC057877 TaxID=3346269 RepID=UPI003681D75B